ncbi:hypothetical protein QWY84_08800 [Aquisalimonas lutea]|uniref:hypothetical protein n=1 Tax=Aquisalimonas lutea TaxID=1327750 RepID=UPI0025B4C76E|nr:hypothetical protein [Aquisalimonas lutea]MDN3517705.1 hypothetical protein [Aquisalimonas lutea]
MSALPASDRWLFLRRFLARGRRIASVTPSSRSMARALAAGVDPLRPQTIVELGAGTGAVSGVVVERMHPRSRLLAVEADPELWGVLRHRVPEAVQGDVADLPALLDAHGVGDVDLVVSGLPVPSLPYAINVRMFEWLARLPGDVGFSQLTVMPWVYARLYRRLFRNVDFRPVPCNLPPGGVYHCRGVREDFRAALPGPR